MGNKLIKTSIILIMILLFGACSSDSETEQLEEDYAYSEILGKWETTSYFCSGGYFVPVNINGSFQFNKDKSYTYNYDSDQEHGTFDYDQKGKIIDCKDSRGWDMIIRVTFREKDKAVFDVIGKTELQNMKIKVERKQTEE